MSATLRICVPDDTTNYVLNPALRYDTSGWSAAGSTISRTSEQARFNFASLKVITNGIVAREGAFYRVLGLQGISDVITVSAYVRGAGRVHIRLIDNPNGQEWVGPTTILRSDRWQRIEVTGRCTGRDDMRLYIETDNKVQALTFYVDGAQMERKPYITTYCDGDQPGCRWNVQSHASISTRDAFTRKGGKWVELGGPCREDDDIYFTVIGGMGMPPITNNMQEWPKAPGAYYVNTKVHSRVMTFTFHVKHKQLILKGPPQLSAIHNLRQQLIDVLKGDLTNPDEPFMLEYNPGDKPLYILARYEGGLEGEWDMRNSWVNSFPIRMLSVDPFFFEDSQEIDTLDFQDSGIFNAVAGRIDGRWSNMNFGVGGFLGADGEVRKLAVGPKGEVYAVGNFSTINYNVSALSPMIIANGVAYWDGTRWNKLGTTGVSGGSAVAYGVDVAANGDVYVCGDFTSIGGTAANGVARWNGSAWSALGTGITLGGGNAGYDIDVAPNGDVYVVGKFTSVGGKNCRNIARWDGAQWNTCGAQGGLNDYINALAISKDGVYVYVGGNFTDEFGLSASALVRVAKLTVGTSPATSVFSAMGPGFNAEVRDVVLSPFSGDLFVCGAFTTSGSSLINRIAQWNGSQWIPLGSGLNGGGNGLAITRNGSLLVVGAFSTAGGFSTEGMALWSGTGWSHADANFNIGLAPSFNCAVANIYGDLFVGGRDLSSNGTRRSIFAGRTIVNNPGSTEALPILVVEGPGRLLWIENQTIGRRVLINYTLNSGEVVYLDFDMGTMISVNMGNILFNVLLGSELHEISLVPGDNVIAAFMTNDVAAAMRMYHQPRHWSADAVATVESMR